MNLVELMADVDIKETHGDCNIDITGLAYDSREVKPGDVFVCISGYQTDGHQYARSAAESGAAAIVAERELEDVNIPYVIVENSRIAMSRMAAKYYDYPFRKFKLIGITGTNGKTTTTYLVKAILESLGKKVGLIGTNQNMIGDKILPSERTTPDSLELMQLFSMIAEAKADYVVMEVSSHALALDRVTSCEFDVGAFTNITQDHLDFHKTMENYLDAKSILFDISRVGVVNLDDPKGGYLVDKANTESMITYGIESDCDLKASDIHLNSDGVKFHVSYGGAEEDVDLKIPGRFSVYNALTALGCILALNVPLDKAVEGLHTAGGVKGRIEVVPTNTDFTVIIDYAHTPDGLLNVLNAIKDFAKGRIITVFGCGGDRDALKRPKMGKIAGELSDICVVTSDNPRTEDPVKIVNEVEAGVKETGCKYVKIVNRFEAIEYALDLAEKDDIILLAGKGHETYQILGNTTIHFDEREIVKKLLSD